MDAADLLLTEVRELVRARGIDPFKDASDLEQLVTQAEEDYLRRSDAGLVPPLIDPKGARTHVLDSMAGLGPLQGYLWLEPASLGTSILQVFMSGWEKYGPLNRAPVDRKLFTDFWIGAFRRLGGLVAPPDSAGPPPSDGAGPGPHGWST